MRKIFIWKRTWENVAHCSTPPIRFRHLVVLRPEFGDPTRLNFLFVERGFLLKLEFGANRVIVRSRFLHKKKKTKVIFAHEKSVLFFYVNLFDVGLSFSSVIAEDIAIYIAIYVIAMTSN